MEVLLLDNYDSFTYNIAQIVRKINGINLHINKPDNLNTRKIEKFDKIIFSPGPDIPSPGNIMEEILECHAANIPVLGICLGLQAIVMWAGGTLERLNEVVHGRTREIHVISDQGRLLRGLPVRFKAGLYHSWIASKEMLPEPFEITAVSSESRIMGIRHKDMPIEAVQFHPESIMTPLGPEMIENWLID